VTQAGAGARGRQSSASRPRMSVDGCVPFKVGVCAGCRSEDWQSRQLKAGEPAQGGNAASSACALVGEGRTCQRAERGISGGASPVGPLPKTTLFAVPYMTLTLMACDRAMGEVRWCTQKTISVLQIRQRIVRTSIEGMYQKLSRKQSNALLEGSPYQWGSQLEV
jgi:hypothetical protein